LTDLAALTPQLATVVQPKAAIEAVSPEDIEKVEGSDGSPAQSSGEKLSASLDSLKVQLDDLTPKNKNVERYMTCPFPPAFAYSLTSRLIAALEELSTYITTQSYRSSSFVTAKMTAAMDLSDKDTVDVKSDLVAACKTEIRALKGMLLNRCARVLVGGRWLTRWQADVRGMTAAKEKWQEARRASSKAVGSFDQVGNAGKPLS
jgi:hypothetical protein